MTSLSSVVVVQLFCVVFECDSVPHVAPTGRREARRIVELVAMSGTDGASTGKGKRKE